MDIATLLQWLFYFYVYCFLGWVFETTYVSLRKRRFTNRGFLRGPMLPIYGSGAVMMLVVSEPFQDNYILTYFAGVVGATALEYVVGAALEAIFRMRYWDYSNQKFNFKGYICLSSSLAWGFLTIAMNGVLHPALLAVLAVIPLVVQQLATAIVTVCITVDAALSIRDALELRDLLLLMDEAKEELERLQRRMDVYMAFAAEDREQFLCEHPKLREIDMRLQEQKREISERLAARERALGERLTPSKPGTDARHPAPKATLSELRLAVKERLELLEERLELLEEKSVGKMSLPDRRLELQSIRSSFQKIENFRLRVHSPHMKKHLRSFLGNPSMRSKRHAEALEALRELLSR